MFIRLMLRLWRYRTDKAVTQYQSPETTISDDWEFTYCVGTLNAHEIRWSLDQRKLIK